MKFFEIVKPNTTIDFVSKSKMFSIASLGLVIAALALIFSKGFNFGIDFTGGTVTQVKYSQPQDISVVRQSVSEMGAKGASVVRIGDSGQEYMITIRPQEGAEETTVISAKKGFAQQFVSKIGADNVEIQKVDVVGPKVGKELKWAALKSLLYSLILIMIYIWFRFDFRFAPGATVALLHDLILVSTFYVLSGREFTIASIAALLTIAGYSINDTIVIYDRVRELFKLKGKDLPIKTAINKAINQTLSRTLITSLSTLLALGGLIFFTTGEIQSFAIAMAIGVFIGTYSTVFIATPITLITQSILDRKKTQTGTRYQKKTKMA